MRMRGTTRPQGAPNIGFDLWSHVACFLPPLDRGSLFTFLRASCLLATHRHPAATQELFLKEAARRDADTPCSAWPCAKVAHGDVDMLVELGVTRDRAREMLLRFGTVTAAVNELFFV